MRLGVTRRDWLWAHRIVLCSAAKIRGYSALGIGASVQPITESLEVITVLGELAVLSPRYTNYFADPRANVTRYAPWPGDPVHHVLCRSLTRYKV